MVKLPALSPGSASHQPRDPGQGLTSLICRTELMMIKIVCAAKVCCKEYTSHILAQAIVILVGKNGCYQQFLKFLTPSKC